MFIKRCGRYVVAAVKELLAGSRLKTERVPVVGLAAAENGPDLLRELTVHLPARLHIVRHEAPVKMVLDRDRVLQHRLIGRESGGGTIGRHPPLTQGFERLPNVARRPRIRATYLATRPALW